MLPLLLLTIAAKPQSKDLYAPAREVVADLDRIVTPNGVQEDFVVTLGGARQAVNVRAPIRPTRSSPTATTATRISRGVADP